MSRSDVMGHSDDVIKSHNCDVIMGHSDDVMSHSDVITTSL